MHSYIYIVAPHLGTLDEAREGPDVELNPKMELANPSRRLKDRTSVGMEDARQAGFI
jgi:cysteine synthase